MHGLVERVLRANWLHGLHSQATIVRTFGLGTGAWAPWVGLGRRDVRIRSHRREDGGVPLIWDVDGVSECTLVTRAFLRSKPIDQFQMHLLGDGGLYHIASIPSASTGTGKSSHPRASSRAATQAASARPSPS